MDFKNRLKPKWLNDKQAHAFYGLVIFLLLWWLVGIHFAMVATVFIGAGVEIYDYYSKKGQAEWLDFIYTIAIPLFIYTFVHIVDIILQ